MLRKRQQHQIKDHHGKAYQAVLHGVQAGVQTQFENDEGQEGKPDEQNAVFYRALNEMVMRGRFVKLHARAESGEILRPVFKSAEIGIGACQRRDVPGSVKALVRNLAGYRQDVALKTGMRPGRFQCDPGHAAHGREADAAAAVEDKILRKCIFFDFGRKPHRNPEPVFQF